MRAGDSVAVGHRNQQHPAFVWCATEDGHHGWVPEDYLSMTGAHSAVAVSITLRARRGASPRFTSQSDQAELPTPPKSAARKGIQPTIPICASVNPDFSCK